MAARASARPADDQDDHHQTRWSPLLPGPVRRHRRRATSRHNPGPAAERAAVAPAGSGPAAARQGVAFWPASNISRKNGSALRGQEPPQQICSRQRAVFRRCFLTPAHSCCTGRRAPPHHQNRRSCSDPPRFAAVGNWLSRCPASQMGPTRGRGTTAGALRSSHAGPVSTWPQYRS
jgi:hypothetical protein